MNWKPQKIHPPKPQSLLIDFKNFELPWPPSGKKSEAENEECSITPNPMKLPRDLCANQIVRALRRKGFAVQRQKGSHIRMYNGALRVTIPNHSSIDVKTLASILRQAQTTIEELMEDL